jgi:hypothetical protein
MNIRYREDPLRPLLPHDILRQVIVQLSMNQHKERDSVALIGGTSHTSLGDRTDHSGRAEDDHRTVPTHRRALASRKRCLLFSPGITQREGAQSWEGEYATVNNGESD